MTQLPLLDRSFLQSSSLADPEIIAARQVLEEEAFEVRQRMYESGQTFRQRQLASAYALSVDYDDAHKWCSIEEWVDITPKASGDRLPRNRSSRHPHECYYLEIKDIQPSDWQLQDQLKTWNAQELPTRATYIPRPNDILLSRFKEPPGKCIIFITAMSRPVYVSSNFILLRAKPGYSAFALLAFLKSSFGLCQLNKIILRRTLIAEMHIYHVPRLAMLRLSHDLQTTLAAYSQRIIEAEQAFRQFSVPNDGGIDSYEAYANAFRTLNELPGYIDDLIRHYLET